MYKKYRYLSTTVNVTSKKGALIRLLQSTNGKKYPLSQFICDEGKILCIINGSYFTGDYVLGRNQGDERNDTHDQPGFHDLVFTNDEKYHLGQFKSWEYTESKCGLSVATVLIKDGLDTDLYSNAICDYEKLTLRNPQSAIAVLKDGEVLLITSKGRVASERGLSGFELRDFLKSKYDNIELLCQLDGGGSSEMIVNGEIVQVSSDGRERPMFNGLALIETSNNNENTNGNGDDMVIKKDLIDKSKYGIKCPYEMKPTYITIHNTANKASAKNEINYMKSNNNEVSFHIAVDDKEAIQGIPFDRNAWHCGDGGNGKGNRYSIGIEICYSTDYETNRHEKAFYNAVKVVKQLMKQFNIPIENVVQHNHWSGKDCPHRIRKEGTWDKFLSLCQDKGSESTMKYSIGQKVKFNRIALSAFATTDKTPKITQGEITKIYKGANYPYLINNGTGFVNDKCITGLVNDDLEAKIKALEGEIKKLKQEHEKELNTLTSELKQAKANLKAINQYAQSIVNISK